MKLTAKAAQALRRQIKTTLTDEGFDGKFADIDSVIEFIEDNGLTFKAGKESLDKKMLMNILGGAIELEPAEEVESDEYDEEEKAEGEDEQEAKSVSRSKSPRSTGAKAADMNRINANLHSGGFNIANAQIKRYDQAASAGQTAFKDYGTAERFRAQFRLGVSRLYPEFADYTGKGADLEIIKKDGGLVDPTLGGSFFSEDVETDLIELKYEYGLAERIFRVSSSNKNAIRFTEDGDDPTMEWENENPSSVTATNAEFEPHTLVCNKLLGLNKQSVEIFRKSDINIADKVARKFMRAAMKKKDLAAFAGDGTSTYGSFVGCRASLKNVDGTIANIAGLQVASGNLYSEITRSDFTGVLGLDPKGDPANFRWVVSPTFYYTVMAEIGFGGNTATAPHTGTNLADIERGPQMLFMGYPVELDRSGGMPTTEANSQVCALFGDFSLGARMHNVAGSISFDASEHRYFDTDQIGLRYREETGINVFGVGDTSEPGSIVGLITAAS